MTSRKELYEQQIAACDAVILECDCLPDGVEKDVFVAQKEYEKARLKLRLVSMARDEAMQCDPECKEICAWAEQLCGQKPQGQFTLGTKLAAKALKEDTELTDAQKKLLFPLRVGQQ